MNTQDLIVDLASRGITLERRLRRLASRHPYAVLTVAAAVGTLVGAVVGPRALRNVAAQAARGGLYAGGLRVVRDALEV